MVILDGIIYNVQLDVVKKYQDCFLSCFFKLRLYFKSGELNITANREELEYTEKTLNTLTKSINNFKLELKSMLQNKISNANCYYEACYILARFINKYRIFQKSS